MRIRDKVLLSALVVGVLGSLAAAGVFGVFSATTTNAGNEISAGTVALSDNDAGSAMYNLNGATPGDTATSCIKVTYFGSLNSDVRLYSPDTVGVLAPYVDMTIEEGTQSSSTFPDCTGFTASGGPIYSGTLTNLVATHYSFATGIDTDPFGLADWNQGDSAVYRFTVTLRSSTPQSVEAQTTGEHHFAWEAQNN